MPKTKRLFRSFYRLLLPVVILFILATVAASVALVYQTAQPPREAYLVTPEKYGRLSARGARVIEENWVNRDGTTARGWLLKGADNAPAVILLHAYGGDRSHVLDLGVKLNEATNFTVLMPDQRGHGENPTEKSTSFGGCETEDALAAVEFLRNLKTDSQTNLVGPNIGFYGVEIGALAALSAASKNETIKSLALDSIPQSSNDLLASVVDKRFPFASSITSKFAGLGTRFYFFNGCYDRTSSCEAAKSIENRKVLLLAGVDAPNFQETTTKLNRCFPTSTRVEAKTDLNPSGYSINNASLEQTASYDQRVIDFFKQTLVNQ